MLQVDLSSKILTRLFPLARPKPTLFGVLNRVYMVVNLMHVTSWFVYYIAQKRLKIHCLIYGKDLIPYDHRKRRPHGNLSHFIHAPASHGIAFHLSLPPSIFLSLSLSLSQATLASSSPLRLFPRWRPPSASLRPSPPRAHAPQPPCADHDGSGDDQGGSSRSGPVQGRSSRSGPDQGGCSKSGPGHGRSVKVGLLLLLR